MKEIYLSKTDIAVHLASFFQASVYIFPAFRQNTGAQI